MKVTRTDRKFVIVYRKNAADRSYDFYAEQTLSDGEHIFSYGATPHQAKVNLRKKYRHRHSRKPSWLISKEIQAYFEQQRQQHPELFSSISTDSEEDVRKGLPGAEPEGELEGMSKPPTGR